MPLITVLGTIAAGSLVVVAFVLPKMCVGRVVASELSRPRVLRAKRPRLRRRVRQL